MKKIFTIENILILILSIAICFYLTPYVVKIFDKKKEEIIKENTTVFTTKVLDYFENNKKESASNVAKTVAEELNKINENPYNKKTGAYVFEANVKGAILVEFDDKIKTITVSGSDKNGKLIKRVLIKPPSFIVYENDRK